MTFAGALAGRKTWLTAIGVGGYGIGAVYARDLPIAAVCLVAALILYRLGRIRRAATA